MPDQPYSFTPCGPVGQARAPGAAEVLPSVVEFRLAAGYNTFHGCLDRSTASRDWRLGPEGDVSNENSDLPDVHGLPFHAVARLSHGRNISAAEGPHGSGVLDHGRRWFEYLCELQPGKLYQVRRELSDAALAVQQLLEQNR